MYIHVLTGINVHYSCEESRKPQTNTVNYSAFNKGLMLASMLTQPETQSRVSPWAILFSDSNAVLLVLLPFKGTY